MLGIRPSSPWTLSGSCHYSVFLTVAALGLHGCMQAFSSYKELGLLFLAVQRPLTMAASRVAEETLAMMAQ